MSNIKNSKSNPLKCSAPVRPPGGDTAPKKVYVCSPFRPMAASVADKAEEQRSNIERALKACRILAMMGIQPLAPHLLKLRLQMAKSSVKKYQAAERCVCPDGRARGLFQFYGASRTGRYSGRNIQLQNLPQNHISTLDEARTLVKMGCFDMVESIYGNTPDVLSQLIRTMLIPRNGCEFIVADFSAIEARVLAWEAGEQWVLDAFKNGEDLYCATASQTSRQHGAASRLQ